MSAGLAVQMFQLYLNGSTLRQIWEVNKGLQFGQVVAAAVGGEWHRLREEHLLYLERTTDLRARQAVSEGVAFVGDLMAAANKLHGESTRRYLQSGNPEDLGPFGVGSIRQYKELVELMLKLSGLDKANKVSGVVKHEHSHNHTVHSVPTEPPPAAAAGMALGFLTSWGQEELDKQNKERE